MRAATIILILLIGALKFDLRAISGSKSRFLDSCQEFLNEIDLAQDTMNETPVRTYTDVADNIYAALNNAVVEAGLAALPLPQDAKSRTNRSIVVVNQCRQSIALSYHDAVSDAYLQFRKNAHLPIDMPAH